MEKKFYVALICTKRFMNLLNLQKRRMDYATSRKIGGSSPDEVNFFNLPNPSSRNMALESTQPLTEISTRNLLGG
jgi:hypothetical protein